MSIIMKLSVPPCLWYYSPFLHSVGWRYSRCLGIVTCMHSLFKIQNTLDSSLFCLSLSIRLGRGVRNTMRKSQGQIKMLAHNEPRIHSGLRCVALQSEVARMEYVIQFLKCVLSICLALIHLKRTWTVMNHLRLQLYFFLANLCQTQVNG